VKYNQNYEENYLKVYVKISGGGKGRRRGYPLWAALQCRGLLPFGGAQIWNSEISPLLVNNEYT